MGKNKKFTRKLKRIFNLYNLAIIVCIVVILVSLFVIFKPNIKFDFNFLNTNKVVTPSGITVIQTNVKENEKISEENAKKAASKQFKELGEKVKNDDLKCIKIERDKEEYYYITSSQNSVEIKINGGQITRINASPINE